MKKGIAYILLFPLTICIDYITHLVKGSNFTFQQGRQL